jgi:hypothetical protein
MAEHVASEVNGLTLGGVVAGLGTQTLLGSPYVHLKFTGKNIQRFKWLVNMVNLVNLFPSPRIISKRITIWL